MLCASGFSLALVVGLFGVVLLGFVCLFLLEGKKPLQWECNDEVISL